jgi:hypothetical protein
MSVILIPQRSFSRRTLLKAAAAGAALGAVPGLALAQAKAGRLDPGAKPLLFAHAPARCAPSTRWRPTPRPSPTAPTMSSRTW